MASPIDFKHNALLPAMPDEAMQRWMPLDESDRLRPELMAA